MLCVWYPDWALRRPDTPPGEPAQAIDTEHRVVAVNSLAAAGGVTVGMRRRQAEAVCPAVRTMVSDPTAEAIRFEPVVRAVEALVPRVEVVQPGLLLAPVTGAVHYFGDEWALVGVVVDAIEVVTGPGHRIGLAAGPFAARCAAELAVGEPQVVEDDSTFLRSLDVASLGREELAATFRWLGITTLGQLADLPRQAMVSRFGAEGLAAHRLARGEDREPQPREVPVDPAVEERFDPPLDNLEQAAFVGRGLAHRLLAEIGGGSAPFRVEVEAESAAGDVRSRTWRNPGPFDEASLGDRVRWQLAAWLDETRLANGPGIEGGVTRLRSGPGRRVRRGPATRPPRGRQAPSPGTPHPGADPGAGGARPGAGGPPPRGPRPGGAGAVEPVGGSPRRPLPGPDGAVAWCGAVTVTVAGPGRGHPLRGGVGRRDARAGAPGEPLGAGVVVGGTVAPVGTVVGG